MTIKVPFLKGGVERIMTAGVPMVFAVVEAMLAAFFVFALHSFLVLPIAIGIHLFIAHKYKEDDYFLEILLVHLQEDDYLEP